jgi:hypothetical protein
MAGITRRRTPGRHVAEPNGSNPSALTGLRILLRPSILPAAGVLALAVLTFAGIR